MTSSSINRPVIELEAGKIESVVNNVERALISAGRGLYQRADAIVRIGEKPIVTAAGATLQARRIVEVGDHALREEICASAEFTKRDSRSKGINVVDPPMNIVKTYQQRIGNWHLPSLTALISAPTLRPDGTIVDMPGYDQMTGLLFDPAGVAYPPIKASPTRADAEAALVKLTRLISTFPFVREADRSVALSLLCTAIARPGLRTAPLHAFTAPIAGSGKSKMVDIAATLATGEPAGVISQGTNEAETEKRLGAMLLAGENVIAIDNVEEPLGGDFLCQMMTQERVKHRILSRSETREVPTRAMVTATGNNLAIKGDLTRRTLMCTLDPVHDSPETRAFAFDPVQRAAAERADLVTAALTIMRSYIVSGDRVTVDPLGGFEDWSFKIRNALIWLGCADPADTMKAVKERDPERDGLRQVASQWRAVIGDDKVSAKEVIERSVDDANLREAVIAACSKMDTRRLGTWLGKKENRIIDGHRFIKAGVTNGIQLWKLEAVA